MSDDPDLVRGIYRVTHTMSARGAQWMCESDLIFLDGEPVLVFEWSPPDGRDPPLITVKLDAARLVELGTGTGRFVYDGTVEDPRTLH